jgi:hypothetical protein
VKYLIFGIVFAALLSASGAWAEFVNGSALLEKCNSEDAYYEGRCLGYISGIYGTLYTLPEWKGFDEIVCVPPKASLRQLQKVVVMYLESHPEKLHLTASSLTLNAIGSAFPCRELGGS